MIESDQIDINFKIKMITADIHMTMLEIYAALKQVFAADPSLGRFPIHAGYLHDQPFVTLDPEWEIRWVLIDGPEEDE